MSDQVDAVVVGAGPAGAAAALVAARAGLRVLLIERGPFPGAKNMYGGASQSSPRNSTVSALASASTMVARRVTQRCTGASSHQAGSRVSSTRG